MAINKVQYGNQTLIDLTNDTVTASTLLEGFTAHDRSGALITGTLPTMTLPSSTSASATGTERASIFPSTTDTTYLNIPSGYNATNRYYTLRALMIDSKTITQNGTYVAGDDDLDGFSSVTVNVSDGVAVGSTVIYNSSQNSAITFSNLLGEPTSFIILCGEETLTTGASPYKVAAVVYDGVNDKVQRITNTSNAQMTYEAEGAYHLYSNGQLFVNCYSSSEFVQGDYYLIYTYGGGAGNIGTSLVQVGSGVTSIQFTGLPDRPIYWSCLFTSNIGTSSGYTRAHVVAGSDDFFGGREMGSASTFSSEHWTASYNNGTMTITSQSTSQGGYFHQPGYYQLTYAIEGGNYQSKTVYATSSQQVVQADSGYDALKNVTIPAVTTTNLIASNIVSGVTVQVGDAADSDRIASVTGNEVLQNYYTGSSAPSSSTGSNGDLYLQS